MLCYLITVASSTQRFNNSTDDKDRHDSESLFASGQGQGQGQHTHSLAHTLALGSTLDWSTHTNPYTQNHGNTPLNSIHGNQDAATPVNQSTTRNLQVFTRYVHAYVQKKCSFFFYSYSYFLSTV